MLKVLIADDESIERRYLLSLFTRHPDLFQVVGEAKNGKEVLQKAAEQIPDVIIMDINMPFMDGLSSAHQIKEQFPDTIILLNTAYAEFEFAKKAIDYGLDAYLLKPAKESQILEAIQNCYQKQQKRKNFQNLICKLFPIFHKTVLLIQSSQLSTILTEIFIQILLFRKLQKLFTLALPIFPEYST